MVVVVVVMVVVVATTVDIDLDHFRNLDNGTTRSTVRRDEPGG
jgi:hypothetical protein